MKVKNLFPKLILELFKRYKIEELKNKEFKKEGTISFADISGFTKLSEELMKIGPEGSEILTNILNFYYKDISVIIL